MTTVTFLAATAVALIAVMLIALAVATLGQRHTLRTIPASTVDEAAKTNYTESPDASAIIERASAARKRQRTRA